MWAVDGVLGLLALLTGLVSTGATHANNVVYDSRDALAYLLIVLSSVPLILRSRFPVGVLVLTSGALVVLSATDHDVGAIPLWLLVSAATVGATQHLRRVAGAAAYIFGLLVFLFVVGHDRDFTFTAFLSQLALFAAAFAVGTSIRSRRLREEALEERATALEATRAEEAKRAVTDERLRIAQELHDVLAHTLSVIAIQAGTGAHVLDAEPEEARRALEDIAGTSRSSLAELRQLLGVLRSEDAATTYLPAPRLADLDRLVAEVTAAGVPVQMTVDGAPDAVTPGVELAAYRIVQEALTNVLKHAGPASAQVHISYHAHHLDIEVVDDGRGPAASNGSSTGHGLIGMHERVAMYGGTLRTSPAPGGGFRVVAQLPTGDQTL